MCLHFYILLFLYYIIIFIIFYAMATPAYAIKAAILYRVADKSEKIEKKFHRKVSHRRYCCTVLSSQAAESFSKYYHSPVILTNARNERKSQTDRDAHTHTYTQTDTHMYARTHTHGVWNVCGDPRGEGGSSDWVPSLMEGQLSCLSLPWTGRCLWLSRQWI